MLAGRAGARARRVLPECSCQWGGQQDLSPLLRERRIPRCPLVGIRSLARAMITDLELREKLRRGTFSWQERCNMGMYRWSTARAYDTECYYANLAIQGVSPGLSAGGAPPTRTSKEKEMLFVPTYGLKLPWADGLKTRHITYVVFTINLGHRAVRLP